MPPNSTCINDLSEQSRDIITLRKAAYKNDPATIRTMLKRGIPVDARYFPGATALHIAVLCRNHEATQTLVAYGANRLAWGVGNRTPWSIAYQYYENNQDTELLSILAPETITEHSSAPA